MKLPSVFVLFIVIILLLLCISKKIYKDYYYNLYTSYHEYRLGDVYNGDAGKPNEEYLYKHHTNKYPKSIAAEYLKKTNEKKNIKVMYDIISGRLENIKENDCILHLRIGDVIEDLKLEDILSEWDSNNDKYEKGNAFNPIKYMRNKKFFMDKIKKLHELNINKINIICGAHIKYNEYVNSSIYIDMIIDLFKKNKIESKLSVNNNPDEDLLLGVKSKCFINTGGGFSQLIKEIRKYSEKLPSL